MSGAVKCRAWDETHKEWVNYGFCLRFDAEGNCSILNAFAQPFTDRTLVLSFAIGRADKHGKDIYDGDILRGEKGDTCIVEWEEEIDRDRYWATAYGYSIFFGKKNCEVYSGAYEEVEIIGNVWEHPGLVEE